MVVGVEVVVGALADPTEAGQLRQDDGGRAEAVEDPEAGQRLGTREQAGELGELALAGRLGGARRLATGQLDRLLLGFEPDPGSEPGRPQYPQWIVGEGAVRAGAEDAGLDVVETAGGVDRGAAGERHRDGVDGEVAKPQVELDRVRPQRGDIDLPVAVVGDDPPGLEVLGELERMPSGVGGDLPRRLFDVAVEGDVDVDHVAAQDRVADGAADDPGAIGDVAEAGARDLDRRRFAEPLLEPRQVHRAGHRQVR